MNSSCSYVLERFLFRLSSSPYAGQFTLKGGLLLATLDARRPTRDGDLLAGLTRDENVVLDKISEIAHIEVGDGVEFLPEDIRGGDDPRGRPVRGFSGQHAGTGRVSEGEAAAGHQLR